MDIVFKDFNDPDLLRNGYIPIATIFKVRNENKPNLKIRFNFYFKSK